jgi:hypothetical protein
LCDFGLKLPGALWVPERLIPPLKLVGFHAKGKHL